jgi:hypothetical protein
MLARATRGPIYRPTNAAQVSGPIGHELIQPTTPPDAPVVDMYTKAVPRPRTLLPVPYKALLRPPRQRGHVCSCGGRLSSGTHRGSLCSDHSYHGRLNGECWQRIVGMCRYRLCDSGRARVSAVSRV